MTLGSFEIIKTIAKGGMGEILLAQPKGGGPWVAIKRILPIYWDHEDILEMFEDEMRIAMHLNHPNLVKGLRIEYDGPHPFLVMEYIPGKNLQAICERGLGEGPYLSIEMSAKIIGLAALGLDHAHFLKDESGQPLHIVHRDVSPPNIMLSFEGQVKVVDFGIARADNNISSTGDRHFKGKYGYMSPEQALGKPVDRRSDVFALGILLYELTTRRRLFRVKSKPQAQKIYGRLKIMPPTLFRRDFPVALESIIFKALSADPKDRYQRAKDLHLALEEWLKQSHRQVTEAEMAHYMNLLYGKDHSTLLPSLEQQHQSLLSQPQPRVDVIVMTHSNIQIGDLFDNRYEILAYVAEGSMGSIFKVRDIKENNIVAIKVLHADLIGNTEAVQRFMREAVTIQKLHHPGIIELYDYGISNDQKLYLVIEWLEGFDLDHLIQTEGILDPLYAAWIALQSCEALDYAHKNAVIHRDLKPENIYIVPGEMPTDDKVKILDFSIAKVLDDPSMMDITMDHLTVGTPEFMSPEQIRSDKITPRSDIYSLGCVMYAMLTGHPPFDHENPIEVMFQHQVNPFPRLPPEIPVQLAAIVYKATEKDPEKRFATAYEMREALSAFLYAQEGGTDFLSEENYFVPTRISSDTQPSIRSSREFRSDGIKPLRVSSAKIYKISQKDIEAYLASKEKKLSDEDLPFAETLKVSQTDLEELNAKIDALEAQKQNSESNLTLAEQSDQRLMEKPKKGLRKRETQYEKSQVSKAKELETLNLLEEEKQESAEVPQRDWFLIWMWILTFIVVILVVFILILLEI